ncbi:MAG: 2-oxoacid:ferredoxin oxidoreductase subunit beta [Prolixibacteraceae bacterium]|nr:2-oxoacid:ferredoxin oxidoreductase subunit beta [Bacteroidota bacterium]NLT00138.1 2-oxoacid:ferredoxin oxidoreductase subunit beta [Bacteroidales bacterium]HOF56437.1 2-oxoacid:ferredoxin oxidoreductase subunit beta [Prolixibacteraceae bacterium]HOS01268.1 2-oxoacid:ferredoxin oxidoreductase subunit beta [Prolixibacteraceae bacterium]HOS91288.1 2-oxoacid:ferredoxin oxidoreductase subunit beta [Prolixibacteraceae bacterium]
MNEFNYTVKDFKSENEVRWCPGCGDYAIMNAIQRVMAEMGIAHKDFAVISGIGCSSRFPYYMSTYGFHTIHGRATAVASGVRCANPDLNVWVITGDGDSMAIGGNHFIHLVRRNINLNVIIFNNKIYGLTKGQYSPTTEKGFKSKTSPFGTIEEPFNPGQLVIGAGGTFFARSIDGNIKLSQEVFGEAALHEGTSIVEVLQNCMIYNHGVHDLITDPAYRAERQLMLKQGEPMRFGEDNRKGIVLEKGKLKVVTVGENGITPEDILVHDASDPDPSIHLALIRMHLPEFPVALGVIRKVAAPTYDREMKEQILRIQENRKIKNMDDLLRSGNTWEVKDNGFSNGREK